MVRLTNQEFHDILDLIRVANSHSEPTGMREDLLHAMESVFRIDSANFFLSNSRLREIDITGAVSLDIDRHYLEQYLRHYYRYDPFQIELHSMKVISKTEEVCPYSRWVKLEYYNDFLQPQKIHHELVIYLRSGAKLFGVIALFRSRRRSNFSQREVLKSHIIAPHLTTALENISLLSKIEEDKNLSRRVSESLLEGILILDYKLRPIYYNFKAKEICLSLNQKHPAWVSEAESESLPIAPEILQDCLALKKLSQNGNRIASLYRLMTMEASDGKRFQIKTCLAQQPSHSVSTPYFLISLENLSETHKIRGEVLKEKYQLTEREMEVIRCVSEGLANEDVARRLFISRLTVETHLKSIFEKTGVKNRTELASRIESP